MFAPLRLRRLFGGDYSPTYGSPSVIPPEEENQFDSLGNYIPETKANEEFQNLLHSYPVRNKPGFWAKLGGALSQDVDTAEKIKYAPYLRELADWKQKVVPYQQAADNETQQNINARIMATTSRANRIKEEDLQRKELADQNRAESTNRRLDIMEYQNTIRAQVAKGGVITPDRAGRLYMVYKTGEKIPLDMSKATPEFMEELKHSNRMEEIGARGSEARKTGAANARGVIYRSTDKEGKPGPVFSINPVTNEVEILDPDQLKDVNLEPISRPHANANRPELPTQTRVRIANQANKVRLSHPEWSQWIHIDGNNVSIDPPGGGFLGWGSKLDQKTYNKIYNSIFGTDVAPVTSHDKNPETKPLPEGKIKVISPDGKVGMIPFNRKQDYLDHGYKLAPVK